MSPAERYRTAIFDPRRAETAWPAWRSRRRPRCAGPRKIATAKEWRDRLTSGKAKGVGEIAAVEGVTNSHVTRMIYRACLAPDIVKAILAGNQPPEFNAEVLKRHLPLPIDWNEQRRLLGFERI